MRFVPNQILLHCVSRVFTLKIPTRRSAQKKKKKSVECWTIHELAVAALLT